MIFQHEHHHYFHPAHAEPGGACAVTLMLGKILTRLNIMPTNAEFEAAFADLKTALENALTAEIAEVIAALENQGVPQSAIDSINAFRDSFVAKIQAVIPNTPPPPVEV